MVTKHVYITGEEAADETIYIEAAKILKDGGLVVFPTETVYGLGADAFNSGACQKIYEAKGRPSDNPLIVHIAGPDIPEQLVREIPEDAKKLMETFWPGPLTIILKKADGVPDIITGGLDTVAVRCPGHAVANRLLELSGLCVAAPSANISGRPSPTRGDHVIRDLDGRVDMIIVDDTVDVGIESTVIDMTVEVPVILRPGAVTKEQIRDCLKREILSPETEPEHDISVPRAPGMKYRHYAPEGALSIVRGDASAVRAFIENEVLNVKENSLKSAVLCCDEHADCYSADVVLPYGKDAVEAAAGLYDMLRTCDREGCNVIFAEGIEEKGIGLAVMNRLIKAAGHNIIDV